MKYFVIAGEASGDLHAAHLIEAIRRRDPEARFRCYGGDCMQKAGALLLCHYKRLAYMGFVDVALHLRTILGGMKRCKAAIAEWRPDAVILVDYPGFNLSIARYVRRAAICPVFYYISPKIWAWKEGRIRRIRLDVTRLYSILPFEPEYFSSRHGYDITYVGNPTVDEVAAYRRLHPATPPAGSCVALLPGSRRSELKANFVRMVRAARLALGDDCRLAVAVAPSMSEDFYEDLLSKKHESAEGIDFVKSDSFGLLSRATAALVTSGTATLETALFGVPQVVCYHTRCGRLVALLRRWFLRVPHVSLVNLICGREVVRELIAADMTPARAAAALRDVLPGGAAEETVRRGYADMAARLGRPGAPDRAAADILARLRG